LSKHKHTCKYTVATMDYQKEYSPSEWVVRTTPELAVKNFYKTMESQSKRIKHIKFDSSVQLFNDDPVNQLQIFTPVKEQNPESMLFAFIPGGYWQDMDQEAYPCVGEMPGYGSKTTFGLITYQISPKQSVEDQIKTVSEGISKFCENHPKSRALAIAGHSAGAHLMLSAVSYLAKTNNLPKIPIRHLYSISGIYDCLPITKTDLNDNLNWSENQAKSLSVIEENTLNFLLKGIKEQTEISRKLNENSSSYMSMSCPCRVFIVVGEYESNEFKRQGKEMASILTVQSNKEINAEYMEIDGVDHFDIIESLFEPQFRLTRMLVRNCGGRLPSSVSQ